MLIDLFPRLDQKPPKDPRHDDQQGYELQKTKVYDTNISIINIFKF